MNYYVRFSSLSSPSLLSLDRELIDKIPTDETDSARRDAEGALGTAQWERKREERRWRTAVYEPSLVRRERTSPSSLPLPPPPLSRHFRPLPLTLSFPSLSQLPFNCQWQELKDLMRGAGSVLRADIAQGPDGRSRGFGSVLFATSQDAERAVNMFNGFEFNGRGLKVRFSSFPSASRRGA